ASLLEGVIKLDGHWEIDPKAPAEYDLSVTLSGQHVQNHHVRRLESLLGFGKFFLHDTAVTDEGLSWLRHQRQLRVITLDRCSIRGWGLRHLRPLVYLEHLDLDGSRVKGRGLVHLKSMKRLKHLALSDTPMTDDGLVHLKVLVKLELLDLGQTRVGDAGLA